MSAPAGAGSTRAAASNHCARAVSDGPASVRTMEANSDATVAVMCRRAPMDLTRDRKAASMGRACSRSTWLRMAAGASCRSTRGGSASHPISLHMSVTIAMHAVVSRLAAKQPWVPWLSPHASIGAGQAAACPRNTARPLVTSARRTKTEAAASPRLTDAMVGARCGAWVVKAFGHLGDCCLHGGDKEGISERGHNPTGWKYEDVLGDTRAWGVAAARL